MAACAVVNTTERTCNRSKRQGPAISCSFLQPPLILDLVVRHGCVLRVYHKDRMSSFANKLLKHRLAMPEAEIDTDLLDARSLVELDNHVGILVTKGCHVFEYDRMKPIAFLAGRRRQLRAERWVIRTFQVVRYA